MEGWLDEPDSTAPRRSPTSISRSRTRLRGSVPLCRRVQDSDTTLGAATFGGTRDTACRAIDGRSPGIRRRSRTYARAHRNSERTTSDPPPSADRRISGSKCAARSSSREVSVAKLCYSRFRLRGLAPAGQLTRLLDPCGELRFIERFVLAKIEVPHVILFRRAGR